MTDTGATTVPDPGAVQRLLGLPLPEGNDAGANTARGWLAELLKVAWQEGPTAFKRPFGFSGSWQDGLYRPMTEAGLIAGSFDEEGYDHGVDYEAADRLILAAIGAMGQAPPLDRDALAALAAKWAAQADDARPDATEAGDAHIAARQAAIRQVRICRRQLLEAIGQPS